MKVNEAEAYALRFVYGLYLSAHSKNTEPPAFCEAHLRDAYLRMTGVLWAL